MIGLRSRACPQAGATHSPVAHAATSNRLTINSYLTLIDAVRVTRTPSRVSVTVTFNVFPFADFGTTAEHVARSAGKVAVTLTFFAPTLAAHTTSPALESSARSLRRAWSATVYRLPATTVFAAVNRAI